MSESSQPIRVLQSLGDQSGTKVLNPYTKLFTDAISESAHVLPFSWQTALRAEYDLFHIHWPEHLIRGDGVRGFAKPFLFAALLSRLRRKKIAVVRTVHNLAPHEHGTWWERRLMRRLEDATGVWIVMNSATPTPDPARTVLTPHGHYRDWYPPVESSSIPGRLLYFGGIRDYKGVDQLLCAFIGMPGAFTLRIAGKVNRPEIQSELLEVAAQDDRIEPDLRFISDQELAASIADCEAVVLPYRNLHNSGSALLALSLNRPIIVPLTPSTEELRDEFGPQWVCTYEGELTATALASSLAAIRDASRTEPVDMSRREWRDIADQTVAAYRLALRVARSRTPHEAQTGAAASFAATADRR